MIKNCVLVIVLLLVAFSMQDAHAQCAMCKATLESNAKTGTSNVGAGLNAGILYLMSIPYILFGVIAFLWYKSSTKETGQKSKLELRIRKILAK